MESKLVVYTILAITFGYLLTSMIPYKLAPKPLIESQYLESESLKPDVSADSNGEILGSNKEESISDKIIDEKNSTTNGIIGDFLWLSTLIVNLSIALTVYLLAKRKFS